MTNVVSIQLTSGPNVQANLLVVSKYLKEISQKKTKLVVLPENFALMPEHDAEYLVHAETEGEGPIQDFVSEHAKKYKLWIIAGTIPIKILCTIGCLEYVNPSGGLVVLKYSHIFDASLCLLIQSIVYCFV